MITLVYRILFTAVLLTFAPSAWAQGWGLPAAAIDEGPESGNANIPWSDLGLAYNAGSSPPIGDYSIDYASNGGSVAGQVGNYADFTFPTAYCDSVGVYADSGTPAVDYVQIEVYKTTTSSWQTICGSTPLVGSFPENGVLPNDTWTVIPISPAGNISAIRFRYHYTIGGWNYWVWDIAYHSIPPVPTTPTVATLNAVADSNTVALQGKFIDDGGLICTAQFEYGTTTGYELGVVQVVPSGTTYTAGMICGAFLGSLTLGQTYHYRVNATNNLGTTHGADVTFTPINAQRGWWVDPTGSYDDPSPPSGAQQWQNRSAAYDDDDQTFATLSHYTTDASPGTYLYLAHSQIACDKIRMKASTSANITSMEISINKVVGGWTTIYNSNTFPSQQWFVVEFGTSDNPVDITGARIRFYTNNSGFIINVTDFDFHIAGIEHCQAFVDGAFTGLITGY